MGLSLACGASISLAQTAEPTTRELLEQVRQLQSKVGKLEAQQQQSSAEHRAAVDETVERVLRDADRRSRLMQSEGFTAGYNNGKFIIQSADGNFLVHPWFQFQFRSTTNARDGADGDDWSTENGFEVRRMKIGFDGNVFSPKTTYLFLWATSRSTGNLSLEEAWVKHAISDEWAVQGGQFKDPFAHESLVSSKKQLAADRTLITDIFTGGDNFVQGVAAHYTQKAWRASAAFTDGARNNFNQNFQDFPTNNADWGAAGRVEIKFAGDWKAYDDFSAMGTKDDLFVLGAGVDYTEAGSTGLFLHTVDAQYENPNGLGAYAAFLGRYQKDGPVNAAATTADSDLYDWGLIVQASYLLQNNWEPFVRYDFLNLDEDNLPAGSEHEVHTFTAGVNYYMHGHESKFTFDLMYLPNGSPVADDGAGILANDGETEFVFRAQYQLLL
jgi:hypothetical protein